LPCASAKATEATAPEAAEASTAAPFVLEDGVVYHTYSAFARGLEVRLPVARPRPKGRNEAGYWWRRHDEYDKR
jgi:predicted dithiol-disulfide oxidoreductase (DUF899 family)